MKINIKILDSYLMQILLFLELLYPKKLDTADQDHYLFYHFS